MDLHRDVLYEIAVSGHYARMNAATHLTFFIRSSALPSAGHHEIHKPADAGVK